ncbi:MAG: NAD(P)/FAD-dependent oxidoreductase [Erysipelotrichaceae bacterium]
MYDFLIIGAGITGSLIARDLSHYQCRVAVLEKDNDVANEATSANSAIIHSGHDPHDGTLKLRLNLRGNAMYEGMCKELKVDFERNGAFVVAVNSCESQNLMEIYQKAQERGIPCSLLSREEAIAKEPNLSDDVIQALDLPSSGIVSPWEVCIAAMEDAMNNGVELYLGNKVLKIEKKEESFVVHTSKGTYESKFVINCAGVYSDQIYAMVSDRPGFFVKARKGEYYVLDKFDEPLVTRTIYPLPSEKGKGVLVVPTIHHNVLLGPNSQIIEDKESNDNTFDALESVKRDAMKTVKNIPMNKVIRTYAGLRSSGSTGDFIIEEAKDVPRFVNVAAIESPGLASAPAIAEYVHEEILAKKYVFVVKDEPRIERRPWIIINRMGNEEKQELVKQDPRFAQMVCRCEYISEGEIVDIIHRNCGARTVKAVKRRVRPGAGRCQGGFCEPRVVAILARELNLSPMDILLDGDDSKLLIARTKE